MTSKAPERIWTQPDMKGFCITGVWPHQPSEQRNMTEYVRADALAAAQEENERLREALENIRDLKFCKMPYDPHSDDVNTVSDYARAALGKEG